MRADDLLNELSYKKNIGAMETYKFYSVATPEQKYELKRLIAEKNFKEAWQLIKQVTGVELQDLGTESIITDYDRAVMEGGHSIEEPITRSALRRAIFLAEEEKKLVIFDIDDTLVHTQTKVHVINNDTVVKSLNSHEFTHYKLKPNEHFDFGDFRDAREFFANAKPIIPMINQLKQDIATGNKVVMVTARADFNDRELFLDTFRKYGINMKKVHVYRAGNLKDGSTEDRKKRIIGSLLSAEEYSKAIMYDDALPNLDSFISLKQEFPNTKFYAWHVSLDGVASEYHRTDETSRGEHEGQQGVAEAIDFGKVPPSTLWEEQEEDLRRELLKQPILFENTTDFIDLKTFLDQFKSNNIKIGRSYVYTSVASIPIGHIMSLAYFNTPHKLVGIKNNRVFFEVNGKIKQYPESGDITGDSLKHIFMFPSAEDFSKFQMLLNLKFSEWNVNSKVLDNIEKEGVAEDELEEDWKSTAASLAAAAGIAGAGYGGMAAKQSVGNYFKEPIPTTQQVKAFTPKIDTTTLQAKKQEQPHVKQPEVKPQVKKSQDVKPITSNPLEAKLLSVAKENGLKGTELAAFMAQCAHETLDFKRMVEFGGKLDFKKYDPKHAPKKAKVLGNKHAGDGERYKGRGFIQLTGRYNYKKAGEELGLPLEQKPQLLEDPEIAAKVAVWFWKHRVQPNVDNFHDVVDVTKYINPAMRGLKDRKENFNEYMSAAQQQGRSV